MLSRGTRGRTCPAYKCNFAQQKRKKWREVAQKKASPERQQKLSQEEFAVLSGGSQEYADWIVELSCLDSFFGAEFNNLQQYRHNLFVGVEDTKYKIEEREKYKYFGSIDKIVVHMAQIKRHMQIVIFLQR